jgi:integrase
LTPVTGKRKGRSAKTNDQAEAEQARADLEYELNHGLHREPSRMPWDEFADLYEREKLAADRPNTRAKARTVLNSFAELASPKCLGVINERLVSGYAAKLREAGRAPATIAGNLAYLKAALRWAADQRLLAVVPKIQMPKLAKRQVIRKITTEEFERLLAVAPSSEWAGFLATAWSTGMRRTEMLELVWQADGDRPWVDFGANRIRIPAAFNKAGDDQWLPLHPQLRKVLVQLRRPRGRIFTLASTPQEVSRQFTSLAKNAGFKITLHDLRRSFGSRYAPHVSAPVLQRLMRHASIETTLKFYTDIDDALDEAIEKPDCGQGRFRTNRNAG